MANPGTPWVLVADPCILTFAPKCVLETRFGKWMQRRKVMALSLLGLTIGGFILEEVPRRIFPGKTLTSTFTEADQVERHELVMKPLWASLFVGIVRLLIMWIFMHYTNADALRAQLKTFDALYILFNFFVHMAAKTLSTIGLYHDSEGHGVWMWQMLFEDTCLLPLGLVGAALDSIGLERKWKVAVFTFVIFNSAYSWWEADTRLDRFGDLGTCTFGIPCKEYKRQYKTMVVNLAVFVAKACKAYATGLDIATVRPKFRKAPEAADGTDVVGVAQTLSSLASSCLGRSTDPTATVQGAQTSKAMEFGTGVVTLPVPKGPADSSVPVTGESSPQGCPFHLETGPGAGGVEPCPEEQHMSTQPQMQTQQQPRQQQEQQQEEAWGHEEKQEDMGQGQALVPPLNLQVHAGSVGLHPGYSEGCEPHDHPSMVKLRLSLEAAEAAAEAAKDQAAEITQRLSQEHHEMDQKLRMVMSQRDDMIVQIWELEMLVADVHGEGGAPHADDSAGGLGPAVAEGPSAQLDSSSVAPCSLAE